MDTTLLKSGAVGLVVALTTYKFTDSSATALSFGIGSSYVAYTILNSDTTNITSMSKWNEAVAKRNDFITNNNTSVPKPPYSSSPPPSSSSPPSSALPPSMGPVTPPNLDRYYDYTSEF